MNTANLFAVMQRPLIINPPENLGLVTTTGHFFLPYYKSFLKQKSISKML